MFVDFTANALRGLYPYAQSFGRIWKIGVVEDAEQEDGSVLLLKIDRRIGINSSGHQERESWNTPDLSSVMIVDLDQGIRIAQGVHLAHVCRFFYETDDGPGGFFGVWLNMMLR